MFYLHDSEKGFTHGCTEVESELFDALIDYRNEGNDLFEVVVDYLYPEHETNGSTEK